MNRIILTTVFLISFFFKAECQTFEMRLTNQGSGVIGVQMRAITGTTPTTANILTDLVFGICWDDTYGVNLGTLTTSYDMTKSGSEAVLSGTRYQRFSKSANPFAFPQDWVLNEWVTIMSIPNSKNSLQTTGTFSLCPTNIQELNINYDLTDYPVAAAGSATGVQISTALPVDLVGFTASLNAKKETVINWQTRTEINLDYYEVEHSLDGSKFSTINQTKAAKATEYIHVHQQPKEGVNYYRLKMMDKDGSFKLSNIVSVDLKKTNFNVKVFPNPVSKDQTIMFQTDIDETYELSVFSIDGRKVFYGVFDKEASVSTKNWQSGIYRYEVGAKNTISKKGSFSVN